MRRSSALKACLYHSGFSGCPKLLALLRRSFARLELDHGYATMTNPEPPKKSSQPVIVNIEPETLLLIVALAIFIPLIVVGFFAR